MTTANQAEQWFRDRLRSPQVLHPLFQPAKNHHKLKKKIRENDAVFFNLRFCLWSRCHFLRPD